MFCRCVVLDLVRVRDTTAATPDPSCTMCGGSGYRAASARERQRYWERARAKLNVSEDLREAAERLLRMVGP